MTDQNYAYISEFSAMNGNYSLHIIQNKDNNNNTRKLISTGALGKVLLYLLSIFLLTLFCFHY